MRSSSRLSPADSPVYMGLLVVSCTEQAGKQGQGGLVGQAAAAAGTEQAAAAFALHGSGSLPCWPSLSQAPSMLNGGQAAHRLQHVGPRSPHRRLHLKAGAVAQHHAHSVKQRLKPLLETHAPAVCRPRECSANQSSENPNFGSSLCCWK